MNDYFEIDFLSVETKKSGDAIALRYSVQGVEYVHVVDGGFQETGERLIEHVRKYLRASLVIDHVVATHPDADHCSGLAQVLEECTVRDLWMLRPWTYAAELLPRFSRYSSVDGLARALKECYPYVAELERIALRKGIAIHEPFQGAMIGAFRVLAPSRRRYLDCVVNSQKTPDERSTSQLIAELMKSISSGVRSMVSAAWGVEYFPDEGTSEENEMSVVQFARIANERIVLTADTGRLGLTEAADFAPAAGLVLPGVDRFQVPHHGSRRNVSTEVLDRWLGQRFATPAAAKSSSFTAIVSSAQLDEAHPRKAVIRAIVHRGGEFFATEGKTIRTSRGAPDREGWTTVAAEPYPQEQED